MAARADPEVPRVAQRGDLGAIARGREQVGGQRASVSISDVVEGEREREWEGSRRRKATDAVVRGGGFVVTPTHPSRLPPA
jgi:hypothetical protein